MTENNIFDRARNFEFYCFGTSRIFERRAQRMRMFRTWITFLGVVTPVIVGGVALSFGIDNSGLPYFVIAALVVGIAQLVLSTWAIVARWDEKYEYSVSSLKANTDLYNKWKVYYEAGNNNLELFEKLRKEYEAQELMDIGQMINDKEKRFAYRESLKYYQRECHICNIIPITSKPSDCDGCGNY